MFLNGYFLLSSHFSPPPNGFIRQIRKEVIFQMPLLAFIKTEVLMDCGLFSTSNVFLFQLDETEERYHKQGSAIKQFTIEVTAVEEMFSVDVSRHVSPLDT